MRFTKQIFFVIEFVNQVLHQLASQILSCLKVQDFFPKLFFFNYNIRIEDSNNTKHILIKFLLKAVSAALLFSARINKLKINIQVIKVIKSFLRDNTMTLTQVFPKSENVNPAILLSRAIKLFVTEIAKDCSYSFKQGQP